ncbi:hypothetical protein [Cohnella thailandensis]|uniref:Exosporium protein C n=1 Tax=Cohnella thailandensis TaxID=557557 RepID=A0A841SYH0_9BACL|nr:hypothetical protein [Cohnella thailandensis]MBB6635666.1 hypothetical protein [Cohnella thailandensis]MBP1976043.1 hypothetical protein [Cohnella thailandensis]
MVMITDFNSSIPTSASGGVVRPVPASPAAITLASFGLAVIQPNTDVALTATVGWRNVLGTPVLLFRIFRGTGVIYSARVSTVAVLEQGTTTFHMVDVNVPQGYYGYSITVEAESSLPLLNNAEIVGPIVMSGTALV